VATLVALDLMRGAEKEGRKANVTCYTFATPAIGNNRLAELAQSRGWASRIHTFLLPGTIQYDDPSSLSET
jgi:Lipase (class 3)